MASARRAAPKGSAQGGGTPPSGGVGRWLRRRHDPLTSLVLTIPVFLFYSLGILFVDMRNGVDLFTEATVALLHLSRVGYIATTLGIAAGLVLAGLWLRGRGTVRPKALLPVLAESAVWAVVMLFTVGWATQHVFAWHVGGAVPAQIGGQHLGPFAKLVMAAGAGFHEELVFRVGLFAGGAFLLTRFVHMGKGRALVLAAVVSSLIFSGMHYVGPMAYRFTLVSFGFRFLAGLFLAAVYRWRGFAVGVYTHALYDVLVFFV